MMGKDGLPRHFVDNCIKGFLDKMFQTNRIVNTVSKRELRICLPFLGKESLKIRSNLSKLAKSYFPECKLHLQIIFSSNNRLGNYFSFKDKIPLNCRSFGLYKFTVTSAILFITVKQNDTLRYAFMNTLSISLRTGCRQLSIYNLPDRKLKTSLYEMNQRQWLNEVNSSSKCDSSKQFKNRVKFENYLTDVTNIKHIVAMSKLRTSDHKLMIEQGRRKRASIERSIRTFPRCESCIENEGHFLVACAIYTSRDIVFQK